MLGVMVQLDGSPHKWFGSNEQECTLLVFIDDATSKVLWLEFVQSESVEALMTATKNYMERYGRPISFYVDHGSVFKVNNHNPENEKLTQFERALKQLDVNLIHANSPQAKGRVERSNKTHQDRLVKELKFASIKSMDEANAFLPAYIEKHNNKFAVEAAESGDAQSSLEGFQIDQILCIYEQRVIQNDYIILYKKRVLQLIDKQTLRYKPKDAVLVKEMFDGTLHLSIRGYSIEYKELLKRPPKNVSEKIYATPKPRRVSDASRRWNGSSLPLRKTNQSQNQTSNQKGLL